MNKLTKASIAGAAGIALLLGGAGTLAVWNDTATIEVGDIQSGTLTITGSVGEWDNEWDLWVPGDVATYEGQLTIEATGDNLEALLTVDTTGLVDGGNTEFADALEVTFTVDTTHTAVTGSGPYTVVDDPAPIVLDVTVTVEFPGDSVDGLEGQDQTVDLDAISFVLTQQVS
ncbi:MAG TPA: alternate-type signal peptide domain-containing protein [Terrimesophilobacter sp.]|nr:alternate-type signal peptide domain-containing protein [Terrimesophilobacter sp.]HRP99548.1 alternate-type signal peptide domain-containing protein [Terrimesophilobacter sp.]